MRVTTHTHNKISRMNLSSLRHRHGQCMSTANQCHEAAMKTRKKVVSVYMISQSLAFGARF